MLNQLKIAYTKKALEIFGSIKGLSLIHISMASACPPISIWMDMGVFLMTGAFLPRSFSRASCPS